MFIYLFILSVPLFFGLSQKTDTQFNRGAYYIYFLLLLFFAGFRSEIGPDWSGYLNIYETYLSQSWISIVSNREPGYFILNKFIQGLGLGFQEVVFFSSLIFLLGLFAYARTTINPWISLAVVMPYLVFVVSMSGIRQSCAIGIGFFMLSHWQRLGVVKRLLLVALAMTFHNSAIIFFIFVFSFDKYRKTKLFIFLVVSFLVTPVIVKSDAVYWYKSIYVDENIVSSGALFHLSLSVVPAVLLLIYKNKIAKAVNLDNNVLYASYASIVALPLIQISSTGVDRLTLYLSFVQMWVYPNLFCSHILRWKYSRVMIVYIVLMIFLGFFLFGTHAPSYLPYKNAWL